MDLLQVATEGLIAATDKYAGAYSRMWAGVAIGRMVGNLIGANSETTLHFYPVDQRRLYRARKLLARHPHGGVSGDDLARAVNRRRPPRFAKKVPTPAPPPVEGAKAANRLHTTPDEISDLVAAASTVSLDLLTAPRDRADGTGAAAWEPEAAPEQRPDARYEAAERYQRYRAALARLPLFDRKLLRLRGIDVFLGTSV